MRLVHSSDPLFANLVAQRFPELASRADFAINSGDIVLVHNETRFPVMGLSIKWENFHTDGTMSIGFSKMLSRIPRTQPTLFALMRLLGPDEVALISQSGDVTESDLSRNRWKLFSLYSPAEPSPNSSNSRTTATIDSIIFANGLAIGPDAAKLKKIYLCGHNGVIAETTSLLPLLQSESDLRAKLNTDIHLSGAAEDPNDVQSCQDARAQEAIRLLSMLNKNGRVEVGAKIESLAALSKATVHDPSQYR